MNIPTVHRRHGKPAIYWPGVFLATVVICAVYSLGVAAFSFVVGRFSPISFIGLPTLVAAVVGRSLRFGLRPPAAAAAAVG